jgi:sterol desaturase/sphingolipid hydroxylase (fatty acid hydroxylase superfamily)
MAESLHTALLALVSNGAYAVVSLALNPEYRIYWVYQASFVILALVAYRVYYAGGNPFRASTFLRFLFPRSIYFHPSSKLDLKLYLANGILLPSRVILGGVTTAAVAVRVSAGLEGVFGAGGMHLEWDAWSIGGVTIAFALVSDFAVFLTHALHHWSPVLWELHKVHHTAEVLTPLTLYRKHPLYDLISQVVKAVLTGGFQGIVLFAVFDEPRFFNVLGINVVYTAFNLAGANLRHSHVWLSFGPRLSRVFVSPAQHQIHHSVATEHEGKNFGEVFALWDWMFGTLYVPVGREELVFGVADVPHSEHATLRDAYLRPLVAAFGAMRREIQR